LGTVLTAAVGAVGLYLAHSYARQVNLLLADRRMTAYGRLWAITEVARPTRIEFENNPLSTQERQSLHDTMTSWYYADGNGMLLNGVTKTVYLAAKSNLVCPDDKMQPAAVGEELKDRSADEVEQLRGQLSIRQLSLLRTQMKTDLAIYGRPFGPRLKDSDEAFLRHCGVQLSKKPWRESEGGPNDSHA
jgi:hypothetical protein